MISCMVQKYTTISKYKSLQCLKVFNVGPQFENVPKLQNSKFDVLEKRRNYSIIFALSAVAFKPYAHIKQNCEN